MEESSWLYNPNLYEHPGCVLQADGTGFEPQAFLQQTTFDAKLIIFHGKLGLPEELKLKVAEVEPSGLQLFETTFLLLTVSEAEAKATQLEEATLFLEQHRDEVQRLRNFPQVENVSLRFMVAKGEPSLENLPNEFVELALNCGVEGIMT
jgi:hypothetical protein